VKRLLDGVQNFRSRIRQIAKSRRVDQDFRIDACFGLDHARDGVPASTVGPSCRDVSGFWTEVNIQPRCLQEWDDLGEPVHQNDVSSGRSVAGARDRGVARMSDRRFEAGAVLPDSSLGRRRAPSRDATL
jgi:hypothetical protein